MRAPEGPACLLCARAHIHADACWVSAVFSAAPLCSEHVPDVHPRVSSGVGLPLQAVTLKPEVCSSLLTPASDSLSG